MPAQDSSTSKSSGFSSRMREFVKPVPLMGWFLGALVAVLLEKYVGLALAHGVGLPKIPVLFGFLIVLKEPAQIPGALAFVFCIYIVPILLVARLTAPVVNVLVAGLYKLPISVSAVAHLLLLYAIFHIWCEVSDYRLITLKLMLISILLTFSLNLINGYMGEFSCSHPGFMALGAYGASLFTVGLFANDQVLGQAIFTGFWTPAAFPLALFFGGIVAALGALIIAFPSFKTRGDYLAIISLAFLFIVKSLLENLEFVGGPRGLGNQPDWATLPLVFAVVVMGLWIMNNFVTSIMGKGLCAVRDDESAAEAMTVDTRATKMTCFLFAAFWAGVAGGLLAHVLRYVNPSSFGVQKLAEVLAMVYFGGLNSIYGSIVGAVSISMLGEMLRPLEIFKWIIIPLLLILIMIFRPTGLVAFKELNLRNVLKPR